MGLAGRGVAELRPFGPSKSALADLEPRVSAPLSGSHLGPHARLHAPCNKAVSREAVCSSFTLFNAACRSINTH